MTSNSNYHQGLQLQISIRGKHCCTRIKLIKLIVQQLKAQLPDIASNIKMLQFKQRTKLKRFRRTSDSQRFLTIRVKYFQTKHQISRILLIIQRKRIRRTQDSLRFFMSKQNDSRLELKSKRKMIDQESLNDFQLNSYNNWSQWISTLYSRNQIT